VGQEVGKDGEETFGLHGNHYIKHRAKTRKSAYTIPMDNKVLYGNSIPAEIVRKAERRFSRYARKFNFSPNRSPSLASYPEGMATATSGS
jgi:hypothetical protein